MKLKNRIYVTLSLFVWGFFMACSGTADKTEKVNERTYQVSDKSRPSEYSMQPSVAQGEVKINGTECHYEVNRAPSAGLPKVKDEQGNLFVDNTIDLKVTRNGKQILAKRFTKKDFAAQVDAKFLANAILEGLVFDRVVNGRLRFAASVCYPQTDLFVPLCLTVGTDGSIRIEKGSVLDEEIPGGAN